MSMRASRRRQSLFSNVQLLEIAKQQQTVLPYAVHVLAGICKCGFGLLFLMIAIVQLAGQNAIACERILWDSCDVKTQFCGSAFQPTCNCAVLKVPQHNWTELPPKIYEMNALKVMSVTHGPLENLQHDFSEKFLRLTLLDLRYNNLIKIPERLGEIQLTYLKLSNNKLDKLPDTVWGNTNIFWLELDNNRISKIPPSIENTKLLFHLFLSNNSLLELPDAFFSLNLIYTLCLDGNNLTRIPEEISKMSNLIELKLHNNNNISNVPSSIGQLRRLRSVDFRNNDIKELPENAFKTIENSLKYLYLHNNPICGNGWLESAPNVNTIVKKSDELGAGCAAQCSMYCQDRWLDRKNTNTCSRECNSKKCNFQNGACGSV
eukprot:g6626.t1